MTGLVQCNEPNELIARLFANQLHKKKQQQLNESNHSSVPTSLQL